MAIPTAASVFIWHYTRLFLCKFVFAAQRWQYVLFAEIIPSVAVIALMPARQYRWQIVKSPLSSYAFIMLGLLLIRYHLRQPFNCEERQLPVKNRFGPIRILDFPTKLINSVKTLVEVWQTVNGKPIRSKVLLYLTTVLSLCGRENARQEMWESGLDSFFFF